MTTTAIRLLAVLFVAHYLGDYTPLATPRMQRAKAAGRPVGPIAAHALVHATLVGLAVLAIARPEPRMLAAAAAIEFGTHLALDWGRGRMGANRPRLGDPSAQIFWSMLGLDQLIHTLVLIWIAALVV